MTTVVLCEELSVRVRQFSDENCQTFTLKISSPSRSTPHIGSSIGALKLFIELTSDSDLLFYYSVSLTESDFHAMKVEQRLLVDFFQLPEMVRQLVRLPLASVCFIPEAASGEGVLSVNEAGQFKELTHLSLKLKRGTDESIKAYLASRLAQYKSTCTELQARVDEISRERAKLLGDRDMCVSELSKLRLETDTAVSTIQAACRAQLAELKEDHAKEIREIHLSTSNEYCSETKRLFDDLRLNEARARDLEKRLDESRLALVSMENESKSANMRSRDLEQRLFQRESELRESVLKNQEYERHISQLNSDIAILRKDLNDQSLCYSRLQHQSQINSEASVTADRARELERSVEKKDAALAKLQLKNKELKIILKETQHALLEQEKVVEKLNREMRESSNIGDELKRTQSKLFNSQQLIDSNSKVISYLNQQIVNQSGRLGLPSPITTPSLATPPVEYPNRSLLFSKFQDGSIDTSFVNEGSRFGATALASTLPTQIRNFKGPVKFTARVGSKDPLMK